MAPGRQQIAQHWMDDHLDLLNYARSIGDTEWQRQLLETLRQSRRHIEQETRRIATRQLWEQFAAVNRQMIVLFAQIRVAVNTGEQRRLREKMWELKLQRVEIGKELRTRRCARETAAEI